MIYDQLSRLTGITHKNAFNLTIDTFSYTYDNVGNRITKKDREKTDSYYYDDIYRLIKVAPKSNPLMQLIYDIFNLNTEAYSYDPVGNRQTGPKSTDSHTYDSGNEQLTYKGKVLLLDKNDQNQYDVNGNLIKKTENIKGQPQVITTYSYDDENRLTNVTIQTGNKIKQVSFAYDPFGRRIFKALERDDFAINLLTKPTYPQTTNYVYDEQNVIAEYNKNNKLTASYIHGPNIDEPLSAEIHNNRLFYHADGLGSITALTNQMGIAVQKYSYDSFGNIMCMPFPAWIIQPYTYTAREYDSETGMYFYRARYYDPKVGRFVTKDPIGFEGGINQYAYVLNDPINFIDPSGLAALSYDKIKEFVKNNNLSGQSDELIICLIYKESTFDPNAKSRRSSATGLMQVTTGAAADAGYKGKDMYDPTTNIQAGSKYLNIRIKWASGNVTTGLGGYGTGSGYATGILDCEKCLKENPCKKDDCLEKAKR